MQRGTLVGIFVAPSSGAACEPRAVGQVDPGVGLRGDRHARADAQPLRERALTLIAAEALEHLAGRGLALAPGAHRRQLVTRGVDLDALRGRRFRVGEVLVEGVGPCRPCAHLEALTQPGILEALTGRGGLTARVLVGGTLRVGDALVEEPKPRRAAP